MLQQLPPEQQHELSLLIFFTSFTTDCIFFADAIFSISGNVEEKSIYFGDSIRVQ